MLLLNNSHCQRKKFLPLSSSSSSSMTIIRNRNFHRSESTKQLLSDVWNISWCTYRFTASYSIKNETEESKHKKQQQSILLDADFISTSLQYYESSSLKLYAELSNVAPKGSAFAIETVVRRTGNIYTMDLQLPKKKIPLFVADLHGQTYIFKSAPQDDDGDVIIGTVCKRMTSSQSDKAKLTYALTLHQSYHKNPQKIAYIDYHHPSLVQLLRENKARPRQCQVRVLGRSFVKTKEPYFKNGYPTLDFHGRGREASIKNMQLEDPDGKVIFQMVKWDRDVFHVDFSYPFDAFHAFGFALAQFDV
jgi:hypothetical protein